MMRGKWIDNLTYVGPDRRRLSERRLFKERRRFDESGEPPSLPVMIRRIRVQLLSLEMQHDKTMLLQLARAAITQAEIQRKLGAADLIKEAAKMVHMRHKPDSDFIASIDSKLIEALNLAQ
jgi:hypothetical protein